MKRHAMRGVIIMLAMLIAVFACAPFTVFAKGSPVRGTMWNSGDIVRWQPPDDSDPVDGYYVELFKDGSKISSDTVSGTSYNPFDVMKQFGHGFYIVNIYALYDDGGGDATMSDPVESPGYYFEHPMEHHPNKEATCTEEGVNEYYYCPECNLYFWNSEGTEIIYNPTNTKVPAKGHAWGEWQTVKEPTADKDGEAKRVCKNDSSHVETKVLPKKGSATTVPATTAPASTSATAPATTVPASTSATAPSGWSIATDPSNGEGGFGGFIHDNPWVLFVGIGLLMLILIAVAVVIVIIIVSRKKKQNNNPPTPPTGIPPQNGQPNQPFPPQSPNNQPPVYYQDQNYNAPQNPNPSQNYNAPQNPNPSQNYNAPQNPNPSQNYNAPQVPPASNNDYNDFFE